MATNIVLSKIVKVSAHKAYEAYLDEQANLKWNYASEGWTTPFARIDAVEGGVFEIGYQSPDGENSFTFGGNFTKLVPGERIEYRIGDGRMVDIRFVATGENETEVVLTLECEDENSVELQKEGWGMILEHFREYVEGVE
jgi:uncharacterized protein YndB with AHSA1/START domain